MCDCISRVNEGLKERGVCIDTTCLINMTTNALTEVVRIRTLPLTGKRKRDMPSVVAPTFCPFCGENRHEAAAALTQPQPEDSGNDRL